MLATSAPPHGQVSAKTVLCFGFALTLSAACSSKDPTPNGISISGPLNLSSGQPVTVNSNVLVGDGTADPHKTLKIHRTIGTQTPDINWAAEAQLYFTVPKGTVPLNQAGIEASVYVDSSSAANFPNTLYGGYTWAEHDGSGVVKSLVGGYSFAYNFSHTNQPFVAGSYSEAYADGGATTEELIGNYGVLHIVKKSTATSAYSYYAKRPDISGTSTSVYQFWAGDLGSLAITNPYYSWFDSRGVRRVKEDRSFDGVGQAIEALYNPQFTKYTPGTPNFERVVLGQWNSNVAEIGAEAGGTGEPRPLRLLGSEAKVSGRLVVEKEYTPSSSRASCTTGTVAWDPNFVYVCVATNTWKRSALSTF